MVSMTVAEMENLLGQFAADMWDTEKVGSTVDSSVSWQAAEMAELTDIPRMSLCFVLLLEYTEKRKRIEITYQRLTRRGNSWLRCRLSCWLTRRLM